MRQLFVAMVIAIGAAALSAAPVQAGKVEVTGVHLCCKRCVTAVTATLEKVDGVTDAACEPNKKTVTFTTKSPTATAAAIKALLAAGFYGKVLEDGKPVTVEAPGPKKGEKADEVTIKEVHVCCGSCQKAISALFKGPKVTFSGTGLQREVKVTGKDLDKASVLETLEKAGFYGKVE